MKKIRFIYDCHSYYSEWNKHRRHDSLLLVVRLFFSVRSARILFCCLLLLAVNAKTHFTFAFIRLSFASLFFRFCQNQIECVGDHSTASRKEQENDSVSWLVQFWSSFIICKKKAIFFSFWFVGFCASIKIAKTTERKVNNNKPKGKLICQLANGTANAFFFFVSSTFFYDYFRFISFSIRPILCAHPRDIRWHADDLIVDIVTMCDNWLTEKMNLKYKLTRNEWMNKKRSWISPQRHEKLHELI